MKIAILTSGILPIPAIQGGAVENLVDFYLEYNNQKRLHDITIYSVCHPQTRKHPALNSDVNHYCYIDTTSIFSRLKRKIYSMRHGHEYYNYFIEYFFEKAYQNIRKQHFDCIILENRPGYAYKLAKRGEEKIVLHLHNDLLNSKTLYHKDIFNNTQLILTVSEYIKSRVQTIENSNKIQVVHNGIDLQRFSPSTVQTVSRGQIGLRNDDFIIVYSGRINKDKGISELIEALLMLQDLPDIKLLVIGSSYFGNVNEEDDFLRSLKEKSKRLENSIIFTGYIPYDKMPSYLKLADVAAIPSIWDDPFPTTVLEAQAMGLPIIASNRGGIPEEVGDGNAIIVHTEKDYTTHLADAIRQLYNAPQKRKGMGATSLLHSKYFNKERFARDFFNALEQNK